MQGLKVKLETLGFVLTYALSYIMYSSANWCREGYYTALGNRAESPFKLKLERQGLDRQGPVKVS
jgi:hypothetical protein